MSTPLGTPQPAGTGTPINDLSILADRVSTFNSLSTQLPPHCSLEPINKTFGIQDKDGTPLVDFATKEEYYNSMTAWLLNAATWVKDMMVNLLHGTGTPTERKLIRALAECVRMVAIVLTQPLNWEWEATYMQVSKLVGRESAREERAARDERRAAKAANSQASAARDEGVTGEGTVGEGAVGEGMLGESMVNDGLIDEGAVGDVNAEANGDAEWMDEITNWDL